MKIVEFHFIHSEMLKYFILYIYLPDISDNIVNGTKSIRIAKVTYTNNKDIQRIKKYLYSYNLFGIANIANPMTKPFNVKPFHGKVNVMVEL